MGDHREARDMPSRISRELRARLATTAQFGIVMDLQLSSAAYDGASSLLLDRHNMENSGHGVLARIVSLQPGF